MHIATSLAMAALLCLSSSAIGQEVPSAAEPQTDAKAERRYLVVHRVSDLPVWSEEGQRSDAIVLVALIKATVAPETWDRTSSITVYSQNRSLVVSATHSTHSELRKLLERLRTALKNKKEGSAAAVADQATSRAQKATSGDPPRFVSSSVRTSVRVDQIGVTTPLPAIPAK